MAWFGYPNRLTMLLVAAPDVAAPCRNLILGNAPPTPHDKIRGRIGKQTSIRLCRLSSFEVSPPPFLAPSD